MYELLWGEPAETKDDFKKLALLVSKIRLSRNIDIESRKGTYFIPQESFRKKEAS